METGGEKATSKDQGHLPYLITSGLLEFQVCALAKKANIDFTRAKKVFYRKDKRGSKVSPLCISPFTFPAVCLDEWMKKSAQGGASNPVAQIR